MLNNTFKGFVEISYAVGKMGFRSSTCLTQKLLYLPTLFFYVEMCFTCLMHGRILGALRKMLVIGLLYT